MHGRAVPLLSPVTGLLQSFGWLRWHLGRPYSLGLCFGLEDPSRYDLSPTEESGKGCFGKEDLEMWL